MTRQQLFFLWLRLKIYRWALALFPKHRALMWEIEAGAQDVMMAYRRLK